ncbi:rhodanese-like domain-containing protein [Hylemonella gracilis]|uniref:Rhodanese-like domain-containing protein n=1 Tax=Hylemonella gracilis TaxID=80880 RepID=A0A4P6UHK5_9BURK|nr:rhodanese-like domain-containing protein [Hylemonella gracilis]QBK03475.1 rhodanese-like domain-containing protein [Hylemonella gracilis]
MDFILHNWALILVVLVSGLLLLRPALSGAGALTPAAAVQLINREKAVLVDVSSADEYAAAHANGAKSVPLAQLSEQLPQTVKNKAVPVIFMCASGSRAVAAARTAKGLGYERAIALSGGMKGWRAANLPVASSGKAQDGKTAKG